MSKFGDIRNEQYCLIEGNKAFVKYKLLAYLTDQTISLGDRWQIYEEAVAGGILWKIGYYTPDIDGLDMNYAYTWFDDFYLERHAVLHFSNLIERIIETQLEEDRMLDVDVDRVKEAILKLAPLAGFTNDW